MGRIYFVVESRTVSRALFGFCACTIMNWTNQKLWAKSIPFFVLRLVCCVQRNICYPRLWRNVIFRASIMCCLSRFPTLLTSFTRIHFTKRKTRQMDKRGHQDGIYKSWQAGRFKWVDPLRKVFCRPSILVVRVKVYAQTKMDSK